MSIFVNPKPKTKKPNIMPKGKILLGNKEIWSPFKRSELQDLRDRALARTGNEKWNSKRCQALRKIAEGAAELDSVIAERDKRFEGYMKESNV